MADIEFILSGQFDCDFDGAEFILSGAFEAGDAATPAPTAFTPTGLEALAHEVFNDVIIDPELFGELVTFRDGSGGTYPVYACIQFDDGNVRYDDDGRRRVRRGRIFVSYSSAVGVAAPDWRWTFDARGETFAIEDVGERQGGCWEMQFVRTESHEKTQSKRRSI